jgi:hypothetical protein
MRHVATVVLLGVSLASIPAAAAGERSAATREAAPLSPQDAPQMEIIAPVSSAPTGPVAVGTDFDVYCSGWLGETEEPFPGTVIGAEVQDNQHSFTQGDILYVDIGARQGAMAGQEYWIVRPGEMVNKWGSDIETAGRLYTSPGRLRIICAQDEASIAEITLSCHESQVGDRLLPFEPIPVPLVRRTRGLTSCDEPNGKAIGHILETVDRVTPIAQGTVVFIDMGELDGVAPGDFLTVYRTRHGAFVRTILGEVAILTTRDRTAVAKVTSMRDLMSAGDEVELK